MGIFYSYGGFIYDLFTTGLNFGTLLAFLALAGMPLLFLVLGFILGIAEAILYNLLAKIFGGAHLELD